MSDSSKFVLSFLMLHRCCPWGSTFHNIWWPQVHFQWQRRVLPCVFSKQSAECSGQDRRGETQEWWVHIWCECPSLSIMIAHSTVCIKLVPGCLQRPIHCVICVFDWLPADGVCSHTLILLYLYVKFCLLLRNICAYFDTLLSELLTWCFTVWVKHVGAVKWEAISLILFCCLLRVRCREK